MTIRQINATYLGQEDRILLRVSTEAAEEFRVLLTRGVVVQLLRASSGAVTAEVTRSLATTDAQGVAEFRRLSIEKSTNFAVPYAQAEKKPFGDATPLVISGVVSPREGLFDLRLGLAHGPFLTLSLTEVMLYQIDLMLEKLAVNAGWNLPARGAGAPAQVRSPEVTESSVIH